MEKEIEFDREKFGRFMMLNILFPCAIFIFFFGIGIVIAVIYYFFVAPWLIPMQKDALRYRLDDKTLRAEQGVVFLSRKAIPLDRITDIHLFQGPLMRFCGIWAMHVQTAGTGMGTPEVTLYAVLRPEEVREEILAARDAYLHHRNSSP